MTFTSTRNLYTRIFFADVKNKSEPNDKKKVFLVIVFDDVLCKTINSNGKGPVLY